MKEKLKVLGIAVTAALAGSAYAADLTVPHSFTSGSTIKSSDMNENFTTIYQKVNDIVNNSTSSSILSARYDWQDDGLVLYLPFSNKTIGYCADCNISVNGLISKIDDRFGSAMSAISFDDGSAGNYVDINTSSSFLSGGGVTYSIWVFNSNTSHRCTYISAVSGPVLQHYAANPDGYMFSTSGSEWTGPQVNITPNVWVHVVGTYDGTTLYLYENGSKISEKAVSTTLPSINQFYIGGTNGSNSCGYGSVLNYFDDVRVYNRALTATEVLALYNKEKP